MLLCKDCRNYIVSGGGYCLEEKKGNNFNNITFYNQDHICHIPEKYENKLLKVLNEINKVKEMIEKYNLRGDNV